MKGAPGGKRDPAAERAYRNRVTFVVVGGVIATLAVLYIVLLPNAQGAITGLCAFAVLAAVSIALEYLMKPGYGILRRRPYLEPQDRANETEPPKSPGTP